MVAEFGQRQGHGVVGFNSTGPCQQGKGGIGDVDGVPDHGFAQIHDVLEAALVDEGVLHILVPAVEADKNILDLGKQQLHVHVFIDDDHALDHFLGFGGVLDAVPNTEIIHAGTDCGGPEGVRQAADVDQIPAHDLIIAGEQSGAAEGF